jgi:hypothetical protein
MNDDLRTQLYNLMYELDTRAPKVWSSLVNAWLSEVTFFQEVDDEWLVTDDATDEQVEMLIAEVRDALDNLDDEYPTCRRCGEGIAVYNDGRMACENPECELHGIDPMDLGIMYVAPEHTRYGTLPPWDKES